MCRNALPQNKVVGLVFVKVAQADAQHIGQRIPPLQPLHQREQQYVPRMPVADATAGFVGYRREVLETIDLDRVAMNGYGFQIEMKYTAWRLGFSVGEVSIIFVDRVEGTSKMSSGIFGEAFFGVLKLPFRKIKRKL